MKKRFQNTKNFKLKLKTCLMKSNITPTGRKKEKKARRKTSQKKIGTTKRTRARSKGKYTGKRAPTGNRMTCSGGETNEDCHGRKNSHLTSITATKKVGDRREVLYNQEKRQIDCRATQIEPQEIWWDYFKIETVLGCLWSYGPQQ